MLAGWPAWTTPAISPLRYRIVKVGQDEVPGPDFTQQVRSMLAHQVQGGAAVVVTAVPVPVAGAALPAPPLKRTDDRVDGFTDLAARLELDVDEVRRALVSKPGLLPVLGEVSFSGSTPEPGEMDGTDASNFANTEDLPFPVLYRGAVTQAMSLPKSPGRWPGGRVTMRKLLPSRSDRRLVAGFLNESSRIARAMWKYCI